MKKQIIQNKSFLKLYIGIWVILFAITTTIEILVSNEHILFKLFFMQISLSFFALLGIGVWQFVVLQTKTKSILLSFINYVIIGILIIIVWSLFNQFLIVCIDRIFSIIIFEKRLWVPQIFIGTFMYFVNILFFHVILLFVKYNEKIVSEEKLKKSLVETRLNMLKAYINPHFLFNSLNSVNALIKTDSDKAREMLVNISDFFRYSIKQKDNDFVSVEQEIENAFLYVEIEKLRFSNRINIEVNIEEEVKKKMIPSMLLQPLFENIIKHAVSQLNEVVYIKFDVSLKNYIEIILSNTYDEKYIHRYKYSTGIGLSTIVERLSLIYGFNDLVEIIKKDNVFKIILKIPTKK